MVVANGAAPNQGGHDSLRIAGSWTGVVQPREGAEVEVRSPGCCVPPLTTNRMEPPSGRWSLRSANRQEISHEHAPVLFRHP